MYRLYAAARNTATCTVWYTASLYNNDPLDMCAPTAVNTLCLCVHVFFFLPPIYASTQCSAAFAAIAITSRDVKINVNSYTQILQCVLFFFFFFRFRSDGLVFDGVVNDVKNLNARTWVESDHTLEAHTHPNMCSIVSYDAQIKTEKQ